MKASGPEVVHALDAINQVFPETTWTKPVTLDFRSIWLGNSNAPGGGPVEDMDAGDDGGSVLVVRTTDEYWGWFGLGFLYHERIPLLEK